MTKRNKIILTLVLLSVALVGGFFLLPDCNYYGGFQMFNPDAAGNSCDCVGLEIYYINEAPIDGISASKCIGIMTNIK